MSIKKIYYSSSAKSNFIST